MRVVEIAFAGYPVTDLERARAFYEGTLGLEPTSVFEEGDSAWIEYDIGPGTLAISNGAPDWKPSSGGGAVALEVDNFDAAIARLRERGAAIVNGPLETPVCHMAIVQDPDGNSLVIHKRKG